MKTVKVILETSGEQVGSMTMDDLGKLTFSDPDTEAMFRGKAFASPNRTEREIFDALADGTSNGYVNTEAG